MSSIFISYRRDDSSGYAGRLYDHLAAHFGRERLFMDVDTIAPGMDFETRIQEALASTAVLLAVMGRGWLGALARDGTRRLDDPADFVRREIAVALEQGVVVIPVLVHNVRLPETSELPHELRNLVRYQAHELGDNRWNHDVRRLIEAMDWHLGRVARSTPGSAVAARSPTEMVATPDAAPSPAIAVPVLAPPVRPAAPPMAPLITPPITRTTFPETPDQPQSTAAPQVHVGGSADTSSGGVAKGLVRASFSRRLAAGFLDLVLVVVLWFIATIVIMLFAYRRDDPGVSGGLLLLSFPLVPAGYFIVSWLDRVGSQTVGMRTLGLRVARVDGGAVDLATALTRFVGLLVAVLVVFLGIVAIALDPKRQGWHDKMSGTQVLRID